jgi:hypothetical protein
LQRVIHNFHDSFGRVHNFEIYQNKLIIKSEKPHLIPGEDSFTNIKYSFDAYKEKILNPIYEIEEQ